MNENFNTIIGIVAMLYTIVIESICLIMIKKLVEFKKWHINIRFLMILFTFLHIIKSLITGIQGIIMIYENKLKIHWLILSQYDIDKAIAYINITRTAMSINIREAIGLIVIERFISTRNRKNYQSNNNIKKIVFLSIFFFITAFIFSALIYASIVAKTYYILFCLVFLDFFFIFCYILVVRKNLQLFKLKKCITKTLNEKFQLRENIHTAKTIFPILIVTTSVQLISNIIIFFIYSYVVLKNVKSINMIIYIFMDIFVAASFIYTIKLKTHFDNMLLKEELNQNFDNKHQLRRNKISPVPSEKKEDKIEFDNIKKKIHLSTITKDW
uniref:G-protein coupled receptors family 1 profile domain-containing protein n=1 Tax=Strongyloides stercoralis TaxID=6248 RepID=A0A0K0EJ39_STRER